ncbi:MAG: hypothetical protein RMM31_09250 [Anaerolineae bacterium]|nr:hypothetical protein [Thermoflexales bacterium]MDW8396413.1 hypothetical protein [Anaerolineae bacterium]
MVVSPEGTLLGILHEQLEARRAPTRPEKCCKLRLTMMGIAIHSIRPIHSIISGGVLLRESRMAG